MKFLTFNNLSSTIPSKSNQNGLQSINPEGLTFKIDTIFISELIIQHELLKTDLEVLNLIKS